MRRLALNPVLALSVAALLTAVAGCSTHQPGIQTRTGNLRHGAQPLVVCGTTLYTGAAGPVVFNLWTNPQVTTAAPDGDIYLNVSRGCARGAIVAITPAIAAKVSKAALARDHEPVTVAIHLATCPESFTVSAEQSADTVGTARVRITSCSPH